MVLTGNRNLDIYRLLLTGEQTSSQLAMLCGCPEASIRRSIQELRRDGYRISFASATGIYRTI